MKPLQDKRKVLHRKENNLYTKLDNLQNASLNNMDDTTSINKLIKEGIINFTWKQLDQN